MRKLLLVIDRLSLEAVVFYVAAIILMLVFAFDGEWARFGVMLLIVVMSERRYIRPAIEKAKTGSKWLK